MQVPQVTYGDSQISINGTLLTGISKFSSEKSREVIELRELNSSTVTDRVTQTNHSIDLNLSWLLGNGTTDPFFDIKSDGLVSIEKFNIQAKDIVGTNLFSGACLKSYSVQGSVGNLVEGSISYDVDSYSWDTGRLSINDQVSDSFRPFLPNKINIKSLNAELNIDTDSYSIQSFSINVPIERKKIIRIGGQGNSQFMYPQLPIVGDFSVNIIKNSITGAQDVNVLQKGHFLVSMSDCASMDFRHYLLRDCQLISINEGIDLDSSATLDLEYKFKISGNFNTLHKDLPNNYISYLLEPITFSGQYITL